ncbi:ParA family protein [Streptococcus sp. O1]|uniref:ParA family protein n=1 Tax=Streptococcus sp. O1 TaxID=2928735 RepID=UPI00211B5D8B|nr:ParA family protein [Streptococcus sp. O1]MCQ9213752.1 ParA family protein [Streptococcus sp. O1]
MVEKKGQRVLLIDMDDSCNLTKRFSDYYQEPIPEASTVKEFFTGLGKPAPLSIMPGLDLITGYSKLASLTKEVEAQRGRGYLLSWYYSNIDWIEKHYDYILIDTHNDFSIFTDNAITCSDVVIAIADIDEDAIEKLGVEAAHIEELKRDFINPVTNESFVTTHLVKIGNKIQSNTSDSHAFRAAFEQMMAVDSNFLGYFEFRTLFAKAKTSRLPLTKLEADYQTRSYRQFFERTWTLFEAIYSVDFGL